MHTYVYIHLPNLYTRVGFETDDTDTNGDTNDTNLEIEFTPFDKRSPIAVGHFMKLSGTLFFIYKRIHICKK